MKYAWSVLLVGFAGLVSAVEPVPVGQFDRVTALIRPGAGEEKWATIAWQSNLWEARSQAAREGKPILLWEMDGHPLACT